MKTIIGTIFCLFFFSLGSWVVGAITRSAATA
jgi:hypothetical protein